MDSFKVRKATGRDYAWAVVTLVLGGLVTFTDVRGWIDLRSPWTTIVFFGGVAGVWVGPSVRRSIGSLRSPAVVRQPRMTHSTAAAFLAWQVILVLLLWVHSLGDSWDARALGLKEEVQPPAAFALGFAAYSLPYFGYLGLSLLWIDREEALGNWVKSMRFLVPRGGRDRAIAWAGLLVNPFTEEAIFRGVLVHMLAVQGAGAAPAVAFGAVLCVAAHLYQGRYQIPFHLGVYATAVGLLFSPLGLWACFGMHLAGDVVPMLRFRGNLGSLRMLRAGRRAAAYAATAASQRSSLSKSSTEP